MLRVSYRLEDFIIQIANKKEKGRKYYTVYNL